MSYDEKLAATEKIGVDTDSHTPPEYRDVEEAKGPGTLKRQLKNRHIAMIR